MSKDPRQSKISLAWDSQSNEPKILSIPSNATVITNKDKSVTRIVSSTNRKHSSVSTNTAKLAAASHKNSSISTNTSRLAANEVSIASHKQSSTIFDLKNPKTEQPVSTVSVAIKTIKEGNEEDEPKMLDSYPYKSISELDLANIKASKGTVAAQESSYDEESILTDASAGFEQQIDIEFDGDAIKNIQIDIVTTTEGFRGKTRKGLKDKNDMTPDIHTAPSSTLIFSQKPAIEGIETGKKI